jgi:hypothetical protein
MSYRVLARRTGGRAGRTGWWPGLVAACLLAAGCAGTAGSPPAMVRLTAAQIAVLTGSVSPVTSAEVANAFQVLTRRCMRSKGLMYYAGFVTPADLSLPRQIPGVPGADISLAAREADGYGFYSRAMQARANSRGGPGPGREEAYADALAGATGRRYRLALDGPPGQRVTMKLPGSVLTSAPTGGCLAAAQRRLYGSVAGALRATSGSSLLDDQFYQAVTSDPLFTRTVARWSSCMARRGLKYRTPTGLWDSLADRIDRRPTPAAHDLEIRLAVADYRCSAAVRLIATARRVEHRHAQYGSRSLAQHLALITRIDARAQTVAREVTGPAPR